jgi:hypothetical protein
MGSVIGVALVPDVGNYHSPNLTMNNSIRLHKEHGLNPTLPVCIVCGEEKGEIALLGAAYKGEAPMHMLIDIEPCDTCRKKYLSKGVLLVEVKREWVDSRAKHEDIPTGRVTVIRDGAFKQVFGQDVPKGKIVKVEVGILQRIQEQSEEHEKE